MNSDSRYVNDNVLSKTKLFLQLFVAIPVTGTGDSEIVFISLRVRVKFFLLLSLYGKERGS
jgi:hypothetical protein